MYVPELIEKLKGFEGFRSYPYHCPANRLSIGYGHTSGVRITDRVDRQRAHELLLQDIDVVDKQIQSLHLDLSITKHSALIEFCFNVGFTAFKNSKLYALISSYRHTLDEDLKISREFKKWCHYTDSKGNKVVSDSLFRRRVYDSDLWFR